MPLDFLLVMKITLSDSFNADIGTEATGVSSHSLDKAKCGMKIIEYIPEKFCEDIASLKEYIGESIFSRGLVIDTSLEELYSICPRKRKRIDSYDSLVGYLIDELDITLNINTKRYGLRNDNNGRE